MGDEGDEPGDCKPMTEGDTGIGGCSIELPERTDFLD